MRELFSQKIIYIFLFSIITMTAKNNPAKTPQTNNNPFFTESKLPFHAPPFDKIKDSDYKPALEEGMKQELKEVEKISNNPEPPTFENTFVALEKKGQLLKRVRLIFNAVTSANTDSILQKIQEEEAPKLTAHDDAILLNEKLFKRIKAVYDKRNELKLDNESNRLVEYYYKKFVHAGANLSPEAKIKLKKLNEEESKLTTEFGNKILAAAKEGALIVDNKTELAGLTEAQIETASKTAEERGLKGKFVIPLENTTRQPSNMFLQKRETREKLFKNSWNRAEKGDSNDTRSLIEHLAKLRADKAKLLGFPNYAAWKLEDQMAKTPEAVDKFLAGLVPATIAGAKREAAVLQDIIDKSGGHFKLEPWDWNYYANKMRKTKYNLDESQIKEYFLLENVLQKGVFYAAHELYGLTFKELHNIPVYQKDVRVFEIFDKDGSALALFYADYFQRDNKSGGAWMDNLVQQSGLMGVKPVVYNVTNFTKPAPGEPALLSYDNVTTMFHEFGHALHEIFGHRKYPSLCGTNTPRDFVEFPSQFNEHWALYPKVLKNYALHYKTLKPMPQELADKLKESVHYNEGFDFTEILEASAIDMAWHTLSPNAPIQDADKLEEDALKNTNLFFPQVPPRYRSTYFLHIWGWDYSAGYYAYTWSEMLDDDAFDWFMNNGGLTRANGTRFRKMILSKGGTEDYNKIFHNFTGHDPKVEAILKFRRLEQNPEKKTSPQ